MKRLLLTMMLAVALCILTTPVWAQPFGDTLNNDGYDPTPDSIDTPNYDNDAGPDIYDAINLLLGTAFSGNDAVDSYQWTGGDDTWQELSSDEFEGTYVFIGLSAAFSNTLNVYEVDENGDMVGSPIPVLGPFTGFGTFGDGTAGNPFTAGFSPLDPGTDFGFMLNSVYDCDENGENCVIDNDWYSQPGLNGDDMDHMITYHLPELQDTTVWIEYECDDGDDGICEEEYTFFDPYLIGFEDIACSVNDEGVIVCGDEDYDDTLFLVDRVRPVPEPISLVLLGSGLLGLAGINRKRS